MNEPAIHVHDCIVIGGGLTGLRAAIQIADGGYNAGVISKVHPLRSHSVAAQGGINAALGNAVGGERDTWEDHAYDTVKGSDYLADQDAVALMCREGPAAVIELEHMGTVFSRTADGRIAQRPFGGAGFPRACYAQDRTGHNILHTLYEQTRNRPITLYDEFFVTSIESSGGRCTGCTAIDLRTGQFHGFLSRAILLATGGFGRVFRRSTNALINTGEAAAFALRAGVKLRDMEFVQFHPTSLYGTNILISEGARGEGGILLNRNQERFMQRYAPTSLDLAPRDVVARAIQTEIEEGRGFNGGYVHLDLTHLGRDLIQARLPGIRLITQDFAGIDPVKEPIPVQPAQHYSMGGIAVSIDGASDLFGLYAAGECACVSVHGANRLGGNSLLETVVFGKHVARTILEDIAQGKEGELAHEPMTRALQRLQDVRDAMLARTGGESLSGVHNELTNAMQEHFGIFRNENSMHEGLWKILDLHERFSRVSISCKEAVFNQAIIQAFELEGMLLVAEVVARSAIARRESRGSHARTDYPSRDDQRFLCHTVASLEKGAVRIMYAPVALGMFEPKERTY